MPLPTQDPSKGSIRRIHWGYVQTPHKTPWHAYLWGDAHWYLCHGSGRSKVCPERLTDGELLCSHCRAGLAPTWNGYVPLVRESDGRPCSVIVHESARDLLAGIKWRERVWISRGAAKCDGAAVIHAPDQRQWHTTLAALAVRADLTETLLAMWSLADVTAWYRTTHGAGEPAPATPPREAPRVTGQVDEEDPAVRALRAVQARAGQASSCGPGLISESMNGRHKRTT